MFNCFFCRALLTSSIIIAFAFSDILGYQIIESIFSNTQIYERECAYQNCFYALKRYKRNLF